MPKTLAPFGYYKSTNNPGLWLHDTWPILFTVLVDNFGVKDVNSDDVQHLIAIIKGITNLSGIGRETYIVG